MEATRVIGGVLLAASGLVLILYVMAKARERHGSTNGSVALAGVITLVVFAVLTLLVLTVLPMLLSWALVIAAVVTVIVMAVSN